MGRLIDETNLMNLLYDLDDARHELWYAIKKIPELPEVEAISKDQYENRLKADMVAMLTEIQSEIDEYQKDAFYADSVMMNKGFVKNIIQQKINALKENKDGSN